MTFYDVNCKRRVVSAGEGFLDVGEDAHIAVNESSAPASNIVTYLMPPVPFAPPTRIDQPQPTTCAIQ